MSTRIIVAGANGRMGREIIAAAAEQPDVTVVGGLIRPGAATNGAWSDVSGLPVPAAALNGSPTPLLADADALIDFSTPEAAVTYARACADAGIPFVCGTTGLSDPELDELRAASVRVPVFYARNMGLGIATLLAALPAITAALDGFDVEIVETHHRHKVDAPSGTALALAEAITGAPTGASGQPLSFGREGIAPRQAGEIGIHAVRAGGNPGEHQIIFASEGEEVRLSHRSFSRRAYALGALRAACFVIGRAPGFYGIADLVGASTR